MLAPERWSELVKDRRVGLDELKGATYEQLLRKLLDDYLERLERESLLRKIDLIYRACDPPSGTPTATSYMFDRTRIERLDRIRHDIVHGEGIGRSIDNAFDELTYMVRTCSHLLVLLHDRFGLMLNPAYVRDFYARRAQTE